MYFWLLVVSIVFYCQASGEWDTIKGITATFVMAIGLSTLMDTLITWLGGVK